MIIGSYFLQDAEFRRGQFYFKKETYPETNKKLSCHMRRYIFFRFDILRFSSGRTVFAWQYI